MKRHLAVLSIATCVLTMIGLWAYQWRKSEPKRHCLAALRQFETILNLADSSLLLKEVAVPQAVQGKTPQEQAEFIRKALKSEISENGLRLIARLGSFGPLNQIFPVEGAAWAKQAGVDSENCLAFRRDGKPFRTEIVLEAQGQTYRVVRCNNVNSLVGDKL
jgi:hypothetical protein